MIFWHTHTLCYFNQVKYICIKHCDGWNWQSLSTLLNLESPRRHTYGHVYENIPRILTEERRPTWIWAMPSHRLLTDQWKEEREKAEWGVTFSSLCFLTADSGLPASSCSHWKPSLMRDSISSNWEPQQTLPWEVLSRRFATRRKVTNVNVYDFFTVETFRIFSSNILKYEPWPLGD